MASSRNTMKISGLVKSPPSREATVRGRPLGSNSSRITITGRDIRMIPPWVRIEVEAAGGRRRSFRPETSARVVRSIRRDNKQLTKIPRASHSKARSNNSNRNNRNSNLRSRAI